MNLVIKRTTIEFHPSMDKGIVDRRYRSGYRVPPAGKLSIGLQLIVALEHALTLGRLLTDRDGRQFLVINIDQVANEATLRQVNTEIAKSSITITCGIQQFSEGGMYFIEKNATFKK